MLPEYLAGPGFGDTTPSEAPSSPVTQTPHLLIDFDLGAAFDKKEVDEENPVLQGAEEMNEPCTVAMPGEQTLLIDLDDGEALSGDTVHMSPNQANDIHQDLLDIEIRGISSRNLVVAEQVVNDRVGQILDSGQGHESMLDLGLQQRSLPDGILPARVDTAGYFYDHSEMEDDNDEEDGFEEEPGSWDHDQWQDMANFVPSSSPAPLFSSSPLASSQTSQGDYDVNCEEFQERLPAADRTLFLSLRGDASSEIEQLGDEETHAQETQLEHPQFCDDFEHVEHGQDLYQVNGYEEQDILGGHTVQSEHDSVSEVRLHDDRNERLERDVQTMCSPAAYKDSKALARFTVAEDKLMTEDEDSRFHANNPNDGNGGEVIHAGLSCTESKKLIENDDGGTTITMTQDHGRREFGITHEPITQATTSQNTPKHQNDGTSSATELTQGVIQDRPEELKPIEPSLSEYSTDDKSDPPNQVIDPERLSEREDIKRETRSSPRPRKPLVPNPKRPTIAGQVSQHKELLKPFRCPTISTGKVDLKSAAFPRASQLLSRQEGTSSKDQVKKGEPCPVLEFPQKDSKIKHRTERAAAQFKSPLTIIPSGSQALIRPTPAIQALERKAQTLKRALRVVRDNEQENLEKITAKWIEAGREVAYELWTLAKDSTAECDNWAAQDGALDRKRKLGESWGWDDGSERKLRTVFGNGSSWGWDPSPDSGSPRAEGEHDAPENPDPEEEGKETTHGTIGTMLVQLGIVPATLGWDEDEGCFVD